MREIVCGDVHLIHSAHRSDQEFAHGRCVAKRRCEFDGSAVLEPDVKDLFYTLIEARNLSVPVDQ